MPVFYDTIPAVKKTKVKLTERGKFLAELCRRERAEHTDENGNYTPVPSYYMYFESYQQERIAKARELREELKAKEAEAVEW